MSDKLQFDAANYQVKTCELDGREITYRAFEHLTYCYNPADSIQELNLFVPEAYYNGAVIHGYTLESAPIFIPNTVGGYMPGPADKPGKDFHGTINAVFEGLAHGYVLVSPGLRGRSSGKISRELFEGGIIRSDEKETDKFTGKAPALVVDMKAVIRFLRYNKDVIPGDTEHIITSGTSAGGALSALMGATGNSLDYEPFLKEIGAAEERDDVFASNCYCPIHNLEHADSAYEWQFSGLSDFYGIKYTTENGKPVMVPQNGSMTEEQTSLSLELKALFPSYLNSLGLCDEHGNLLSLDENGEGSFKEYVKRRVMDSVQKELDSGDAESTKKQPFLSIEMGKVTDMDWDGYLHFITRMKSTPAFDALDLKSPENEEFGTESISAQHFTEFGVKHSKVKGTMAAPEIIKMLNPIPYIGAADTAKYWRIRHGASDRDTSLAVPVILATLLQNKGYEVDFHLPWGVPHSGDYDLQELFAWIDSICKVK